MFLWLGWGVILLTLILLLQKLGLVKEYFAFVVVAMFFFYLGGLFLLWLFKIRKAGWSSIGFTDFSFSALIWGVFAFLLFFSFSTFYGYILGFFGYDLNKAYELSRFFQKISGWWIIPTFLVVGFLGPLTEESFFRGYLYLDLKEKKGFLVALLFSSFVFSLLHMSLPFIIPFWFFGVLSALMLEKRNSLDASLIFHILNNVLALVAYVWFQNKF